MLKMVSVTSVLLYTAESVGEGVLKMGHNLAKLTANIVAPFLTHSHFLAILCAVFFLK